MDQLRTFAVNGLPKLVIPIAILVVGWVVALALGALVRAGLHKTGVDEKLAKRVLGEERAAHIDTARWVGKVVYYVALVFVSLARRLVSCAMLHRHLGA